MKSLSVFRFKKGRKKSDDGDESVSGVFTTEELTAEKLPGRQSRINLGGQPSPHRDVSMMAETGAPSPIARSGSAPNLALTTPPKGGEEGGGASNDNNGDMTDELHSLDSASLDNSLIRNANFDRAFGIDGGDGNRSVKSQNSFESSLKSLDYTYIQGTEDYDIDTEVHANYYTRTGATTDSKDDNNNNENTTEKAAAAADFVDALKILDSFRNNNTMMEQGNTSQETSTDSEELPTNGGGAGEKSYETTPSEFLLSQPPVRPEQASMCEAEPPTNPQRPLPGSPLSRRDSLSGKNLNKGVEESMDGSKDDDGINDGNAQKFPRKSGGKSKQHTPLKCRIELLLMVSVAILFLSISIAVVSSVAINAQNNQEVSAIMGPPRVVDRPLSEQDGGPTVSPVEVPAVSTTAAPQSLNNGRSPSAAPSPLPATNGPVQSPPASTAAPTPGPTNRPTLAPATAAPTSRAPSTFRASSVPTIPTPRSFPLPTPSSTMPSSDPTESSVATPAPSSAQSPVPTQQPSPATTPVPSTQSPSQRPSMLPSQAPSQDPSEVVSRVPSALPSEGPSVAPSTVPTNVPTSAPTEVTPTQSPSEQPEPLTRSPSAPPSSLSDRPSRFRTPAPTLPSPEPTIDYSLCRNSALCRGLAGRCCPTWDGVYLACCDIPSKSPSQKPTTSSPTEPLPSPSPAGSPTPSPISPSPTDPQQDSAVPSSLPTAGPTTDAPTSAQPTSRAPTLGPTSPAPTSLRPTPGPTLSPVTPNPSSPPTAAQSSVPSALPTVQPVTPVPSQEPNIPLPTLAPTPDVRRAMVIAASPPPTGEALNDPTSPQSLALEHILNHFVGSVSVQAEEGDWRILQQFALLTYYFQTLKSLATGAVPPAGSNARRIESSTTDGRPQERRRLSVVDWLDAGPDECDWPGIRCTQGKVVSIIVAQQQLPGELVPEFALLKDSLFLFDATGNKLNGCIPEYWGELRMLRWLRISQNELTCNIPSSFANMTQLMQLDVHRNNLQGLFPNDVISQMTGLRNLRIYFNDLTGSIDDSVCALGMSVFEADCGLNGACVTNCW